MEKAIILKLHKDFEQSVYKDQETGLEFWLARGLQDLLGYAKWENFAKVIEKAKTACKNSGIEPRDHFPDIRKMVDIGSGAKREIEDIALTRYACYLIAQNGDPSKDPIAFAQTYFAVQTRKQEVIEQRITEVERFNARKKLALSEKQLSGIIYERLQDEQSFARIRSKGDTALFGKTTGQMKEQLNIPRSRALADFLPTITIKAKDFANEITNFNVKRDNLRTEAKITREHVKNSQGVRKLLIKRNIKPEELPPAEDIKKVQRRLVAEQKKLNKTESLDLTNEQ
ncbi:MAG: DNA damage-inducible protein D [Planctomycetes bacterium]|nr:DNA damage-inducible protein D [Planctomycetota bacterium]MBU1517403.1 DNA damage-inducible protein D [Planctomycetota bacterium]MBU2457763.1 DNA damage-inducible protein D [Planctomycetota bacterium]MBU2597420.1 DNA damage-inducible protein D [Planctomycetota bacterium]